MGQFANLGREAGRGWVRVAVAATLLLAAQAGAEDAPSKSGYEDVPAFGGPSSTGEMLKEDDADKTTWLRAPSLDKALESWFAYKKRLKKEHGLAIGVDYTGYFLGVNESPGETSAGSGMARLFGNWSLTGDGEKSNGSIVFKVEHRHRYTDIPANALGFEAGANTLLAPPFGNQALLLTNLYWQQRNKSGKLNFVAGVVDATDYLNIYGLINPWTHFTNFEFSTGTTIAVPNQGLGAAFGAALSENLYVIGGLADANADPSSPDDMFDSFFSDHEFFTHVELGWYSSYGRRYFDNVHVTAWHQDERDGAGVPDSWGVAFSATKFIDDKIMPFLRAGYSDGGAAIMKTSVTAGVGFYNPKNSDLLAIGLGWAEPFSGLRDQYTIEIFYRLQIAESLALTPDVQLVIDPSLNPSEDTLFFFGFRLRLTF
ncbi:MAG: carbohydrate porin [Planctomycetota bacterium]